MALAATTVWEVQTGGSDTANSGAFDPGQTAGMFTDGAATSATGNSPVFSSASYNFVAGDVAAWVYIGAGTNWTPGWYKIASVAANAATLTATVGAAVTQSTLAPNTIAGVATVASPTGATWSIDYSQQTTPRFTYTDLASAGTGLTVSSVLSPFGQQHVGNSLVITGGTNFNVGRYVIASIAATVATVVGPTNITTGAGALGTGAMGGAIASIGQVGAVHRAGNKVWAKTGTYTISSASSNVAGGCITLTASTGSTQTRLVGYGSVRGDNGTRPTFQASGISVFTVVTPGIATRVENVIVDGASLTTSRGINNNAVCTIYRCKVINCTSFGININTAGAQIILCEVTGMTSQPALQGLATFLGCVAHDNTSTGFSGTGPCIDCVSVNNTGGSSRGFATYLECNNCVAYGNGSDGFQADTAATKSPIAVNCISVNNGGFGYAAVDANGQSAGLVNCAVYNNTSGAVDTNLPTALTVGFITLTGSPFTNAAGLVFSLNNTAGAGTSCRAAGIPSASGLTTLPGISTPAYLDVGAAQTQAALAGMLYIPNIGGM